MQMAIRNKFYGYFNPMKSSGIYVIINKISGKCYVGGSVNIEKRWKEHKQALKTQTHHNKHLQRAWNKYGSKQFQYKVILICEVDDVIEYEQLFLNNFKWGYNIAIYASAGMRGLKHSQEAIDKIKVGRRNRKYTAEEREYRSNLYSDDGNPFYEKTHTQDSRNKMSKAHMGLPSGNKGKKMSITSRKLLSKNRTGKCTDKSHWRTRDLINISTGDIYHSITEAAKKIGVKRTTLGACLSGQNPNKYGVVYL